MLMQRLTSAFQTVELTMASDSNIQPTRQPDPNWKYCGVNLTIHNIIIPEERLFPTPSQLDKMDYETEIELRIVGCELIQDSGILLRLPQVAMATAQVLYQRFFYSKSFVRHFYEHYAMACIFLSAKLEESPRRIRDVINVFHHIRQLRENKTLIPVTLDQSYSILKNQIIKAERRILKELGFCVHAKHPHKALDHESNKDLVQIAWNYMNDSLRTDIFVRYLPEAIACGCIHLASCKLNVPLPRNPAWWEMFSVSDESVHEITLCLLRLYARPKIDVARLEFVLSQLKKSQTEAKERENELKKQKASTTSPSARSDHSFGYVSPPNRKSKSRSRRKSNGTKKVTDFKSESEDVTNAYPPSSLLASALANAKAVAATVTATKTDVFMDNESPRYAVNPSCIPIKDFPSDEEMALLESPDKLDELNNLKTIPSEVFKKSDALVHENPVKVRTIVRPAAYSDVPSSQSESTKRHRHRKQKYSTRRHYNSISPSSSSSERETDQNLYDTTMLTNNSRPRNYRQKLNDVSTSASETENSSPSSNREIANVHNHRKNYSTKRKHIPRSSSEDSQTSSLSDDPRFSPMHNMEKSRSRRRRLSPPYAYRIDYEKSHKSKHRSSMRSAPNGESGRNSHEHSNHRLIRSSFRDHRR